MNTTETEYKKLKREFLAEDKFKPQTRIKLAPSIARILNMSHEVLIEHYIIIAAKASSLPSTQRKRIVARTKHLLEKGTITKEQIEKSIEFITSIQENDTRGTTKED